MPQAKDEEPWFQQVAEKMIREGIALRDAYFKLFSVVLSPEDADNFFRRKNFQRVLRAERLRFFNELGADPLKTKQTALGRLEFLIQRLVEDGEYEKAAEVQFKAAKIEGWLSPDTNVNVFANLSDQEMQELKKRVREQIEAPKGVN